MNERSSLNKNIDALLQSIDLCFKHQFISSGLALLYSAIDILAWLALPQSQNDVHRDDFVAWVERYLLPKSNLNCSALDLYAARCSIIHSFSSESALSRSGIAHRLCYTIGDKDPKELQQDLDSVNYNSIVVHIDTMFLALRTAVDAFKKDLASDEALATRVFGRSETAFYTTMP
jgi:hypothetical protein